MYHSASAWEGYHGKNRATRKRRSSEGQGETLDAVEIPLALCFSPPCPFLTYHSVILVIHIDKEADPIKFATGTLSLLHRQPPQSPSYSKLFPSRPPRRDGAEGNTDIGWTVLAEAAAEVTLAKGMSTASRRVG